MPAFVPVILTLIAALISVPVAVFLVEVIAAAVRCRDRLSLTAQQGPRGRLAVLIPAHDESKGLVPTLTDVKQQLHLGDRVLVVADNCTDDTAAIARTHGAEVIERHDSSRRGKGFALAFGISHLDSDPPDIVVMIDADCRLASHAIDEVVGVCATTRRPVQALYLMTSSADAQINHQVAEFAWRVKNLLRPLGLKALGLPCQLMGTGMAFPWEVLQSADLATSSIVEDLKLGLDLAANGYPPLFCPSACVTSQFGASARAARTQRERWEHGHLHAIITLAPKLLYRAAMARNWNLLTLTLDLAVPPLSLIAILVFGMFMATAALQIIGYSSIAFPISSASLLGFILAVGIAWQNCGRSCLPLRSVFLIVPHVIRKLGLYRRSSNRGWVRTDRSRSE